LTLIDMQYLDKAFTPEKINNKIIAFCNSINKSAKAQFIDVIPDKDAQPLECIKNVKTCTQKNGGQAVLGWAIWLHPNLYLEAEFHSIHKTLDNKLIDVTPHKDNPLKILFLEDFQIRYKNVQINNIRKNISGLKLVDRYINNINEIFKITNKGNLKYQHGKIILKGEAAKKYRKLLFEKDCIMFEMNKIGLLLINHNR